MIRAAILPYWRHPSACAIVVVHEGSTTLYSESVPVGHLECLLHQRYPCPECTAAQASGGGKGLHFRRVVGEAEIAAVVARVVELVREHGAELVTIEEPGGKGVEAERGREISAALLFALPLGIERRINPEQIIAGVDRGDLTARLRPLLAGGPDLRVVGVGADGEHIDGQHVTHAEHDASGPTVHGTSVTRGNGGEAEHERSEVVHANQASMLGCAGKGPRANPEPLSPLAAGRDADPAPLPAQALRGRRVLGVDPGTARIACVVLEELHEGTQRAIECSTDATIAGRIDGVPSPSDDTAEHRAKTVARTPHPTTPARFVASLVLAIGSDVARRSPKVTTRKDGTTVTRKTRHVVTDADMLDTLRAIARFGVEHCVEMAVVETATFVHVAKEPPCQACGQVRQYVGATVGLLRANKIGGEIAGWLRAAQIPVQSTSSKDWRKAARKMAKARGAEDETSRRDHTESGGLRGGAVRPGAVREGGGPSAVSHGAGAYANQGAQEMEAGERSKPAVGGDGVSVLTWPAAVRSLVAELPADLPPEDREHVLDATGAALLAFAPTAEEERAARKPKAAPRAKGAAKGRRGPPPGCTCSAAERRTHHGHKPGCPAATRRGALCSRCKGPRRGHTRGLPCPVPAVAVAGDDFSEIVRDPLDK